MYAQLDEAWAELTRPGQMFEVVMTEALGRHIRTYALAPPSLRDIWLSTTAYAERDYLVYEEERWTYAQAHEEIASAGAWLSTQGVLPGDRVAIAMRNYPEWMLAYWAITSIGAVVVGMNAWWVAEEMAYGLKDSNPRVIIVDQERLERIETFREEVPDLKVVGIRLPEKQDGVFSWPDLVRNRAALPDVTIAPDDDACIFYTSGTTGRPKGARLTHRSCVNNIMNVAFAQQVQSLALAKVEGEEAVKAYAAMPPKIPAALVTTPLFHVTANNCGAHPVTIAGGKLVHMYRWDAGEALRLIEKEKITATGGVPVMSREIISHPDFARRDTSSLESIGGGGAQLQPDLVHKLDEKVENARPNTGYGMTETSGIITAIGADFFVDKPASAGRLMPTFEGRCVDEKGNDVAPGERGELWVRGAPVIKGYLNREDATAESITDGWLHTGDIACIDQEGFVFIVDRAKDMVLRGGENVYCSEVETIIFEHQAIAECAVFSVPDERLGEEVGCAIALKPGKKLGAAEIRLFCKERLAPFKIPRYLWIGYDLLPRNANGKFMKRKLQETLQPGDAD